MQLRAWRKSKNLTLEAAVAYLGLKSMGALSDLERGVSLPSWETAALIEGATGGLVTIVDHWAAWRRAHPVEFATVRAAGQSAAKAHRHLAFTKPGGRNGRKA